MIFREEWRAAAAAAASVTGVCFASGRTAAMFFAQTGSVSWLGVAVAAAVFGSLAGGICGLARSTKARSVSGMLARSTGPVIGAAAGIAYGTLMLLSGLIMLWICGNLASLVLPLRNARPMGMLCALMAAFMLCRDNMRGRKRTGMAVIAVCAVFFGLLYLDPRPVRFRSSYETTLRLQGSAPAAAALGVLFGALCALVCADTVLRRAEAVERPFFFGLKCGVFLLVLLVPANAALLRGGEKLLSQALPAVVLAARWGTAGFYGCAGMMNLCAVSTLAAVVGASVKHDKKAC